MKKIFLSLFIIGLLTLVSALFFIRFSRLQPAVRQSKESQAVTIGTAATQMTEAHPQQPAEEYVKEFSLPQDLEAELSEASKNGDVNTEWAEGRISKEELQEAGLTITQLTESQIDNKIKNITAGYSLSDKAFAERLHSCLPTKNSEGGQSRVLNSEALSAMGFSALMEHKYKQAEEAFRALIRDYADTQAAPMAHLELARLISEQGRFTEAQQLVDRAISQYGNDKEYVAIAHALKEEIEADE